jgi:hypothetical protein
MINLEELLIFGLGLDPPRAGGTHSILPSTLEDCEFRLSAFGGQTPSFTSEDLWRFLLKHPEIRYWVPSDPLLLSISSFPRDILPGLRAMVLIRSE